VRAELCSPFAFYLDIARADRAQQGAIDADDEAAKEITSLR